MAKFYITTTLPYVNAEPHIGFALEIVQADVIARWRRLLGEEVFFNTGTDEHGLKIYRAAQQANVDPQSYVDSHAVKFDKLKQALNLSYTNFIRTTDEHHIRAAQEFWRRCAASGDIYKKNYQVKYCVGCELEKTESELEEGRCPFHSHLRLEIIEEENYFFRYSKYQQRLLRLYEERPDFVIPPARLNEIKKFTQRRLQDFSISRLRTKLPWGVPVPDDEDQVMYVWFDALVNYVSALGWPADKEKFNLFWPGIQVAGKDNLRQQASMWQAMLLSAGLPPSRQIFIHGFITAEGEKMSKSRGNVIDPFQLVAIYGTDAVRYYLLREIPPYWDGDFSEKRFRERYNADLANDLGNLVQRILKMIEKYNLKIDSRRQQLKTGEGLIDQVNQLLRQYQFDRALTMIWQKISWANQYIDKTKPWEKANLGKTEELTEILSTLHLILKEITMNLEPFLPETAEKLKKLLAVEKIRAPEKPLFPKL